MGQDLVFALVFVVLVHALDLGLHDDPAHLGGVPLRLGGLVLLRAHGLVHGLPDILLLGVLQLGLPGPDGLIGVPQLFAVQPILLGLDARLPGLVVALAHAGVQVGLRVPQVVHHSVIRGGQLFAQSAELLLDIIQNRLGGLCAADFSIGDHFADPALVRPGTPGEGLIHIQPPLGEVIQILLGCLVRGPHPA